MSRELLKQALDALVIGAWYVDTEFGDRAELDQCNAAIEALKAELAKQDQPDYAPGTSVFVDGVCGRCFSRVVCRKPLREMDYMAGKCTYCNTLNT